VAVVGLDFKLADSRVGLIGTAQQRTDESAVPLHIAVCVHVHAVLHDSVAVHGRHERLMP
jgi:hypothetical protein